MSLFAGTIGQSRTLEIEGAIREAHSSRRTENENQILKKCDLLIKDSRKKNYWRRSEVKKRM